MVDVRCRPSESEICVGHDPFILIENLLDICDVPIRIALL